MTNPGGVAVFRVTGSKKALVLSLALTGLIAPAGRILAGPLSPLDDAKRFEFIVLDDETSQPIKDAAVWLIDPFGNASDDGDEFPTISDDRGRAPTSRDLDLGELVNDVEDGNQLRVFGWRVKVAAEGYRKSTTPLFEHTGEVIDPRTPKLKNPTIRLTRRIKADVDHAPETDTFSYRESGICRSLVFYGDKFDALRSCPKQCSEHTPWFETKCGDVREADGVLLLKIRRKKMLRPRDGEGEKDDWPLDDLVRVRWGRRQYLIEAGQGIAFCNAVNQGKEPRDDEFGDFALGEGHEAIAVTGRPEIPERWSQYLLKVPVRGEVIQLLSGMKARVNVGLKHGLKVGMELVPNEWRRFSGIEGEEPTNFSDMEIVSVEEAESVVRTKYPDGMYRKIRVGDVVSTQRPIPK